MAALGLEDAVRRFLAEVTPPLASLAGRVPTLKPEHLAGDVALEAFELCAALVDADGLHTDAELWALSATFGPLLPTQIGRATPDDIRRAGLIGGKGARIDAPSAMFDVLVAADRRDGTASGWTYYERAMELAHEVAALDVHVSATELAALERLRGTLLTALGRGGGTPGQAGSPIPTAVTGGPAGAPAVAAQPVLPPTRPLEELYAELDALVGLEEVKAEVKLVANLLKVQALRTSRGLPIVDTARHVVFTGNPGTGKTTVARLLAQIYRTLGVVERGHLVETDRAGMVAGFVGQTAIKTTEIVKSAIGGVLLIDEAYALARGQEGDFGREAIDTLVKLMEDHRNDLVVIVTGYPREMAVLVESNPGLQSRFPRSMHFPDYTSDQLLSIFDALCERNGYAPEEGAREALRTRLDIEPRGQGFGNARLVRNLFEASLAAQASRVVTIAEPTDEQLCALSAADVDAAVGIKGGLMD